MNFQPFRVVAIALLLLVTILLFQRYEELEVRDPSFVMEATTRDLSQENLKPYFESSIIPQPNYLPAAHSSSFTTLPNGDLIAFWFAGTKEGASDVKIWRSIYHNGSWSMATPLVDPRMISEANHRYVVKVGNPVIYRAHNGELHLFVVSVSVGGWSGSNLNHLISDDNGKTWSKPERIVISPFFNISTLVRTAAISLANGGFYLPVYHEFIRKYPEILMFDNSGKFVEQIRISSKNHMLQPSVVPISANEAWAYFRNGEHGANNKHVLYMSKTENGGKTWSTPVETNLLNYDASIVAENLNDGRYMMVYNQGMRRNQLWIAVSNDGIHWRPVYSLESHDNDEFSYPAVEVNNDIIDIMYTNNRKNIKHVRFNREWLNEVIANAK